MAKSWTSEHVGGEWDEDKCVHGQELYEATYKQYIDEVQQEHLGQIQEKAPRAGRGKTRNEGWAVI